MYDDPDPRVDQRRRDAKIRLQPPLLISLLLSHNNTFSADHRDDVQVGRTLTMSEGPPTILEHEAGPSTAPTTRDPSPDRDPTIRPLRRLASHGRLSKLMLPGRSRSSSSASRAESVITAFADEAGPSNGRITPEQRWRSSRGEH